MNIEVTLTPGAARDEIAGWRDGVLRVRVTAPPVDGAANEALRRLLAKRLGVATGRVTIIRGHRGRRKLVGVDADEAVVRGRLA